MNRQHMRGALKTAMFATASTLIVSAAITATTAHEGGKKEGGKREGFNEPFVLSHLKHMKVVVGKLDDNTTARGESEDHLKHLVMDGLAPCHIAMTEGDDCCGGAEASKGSAKGKSSGCGPSDTPLAYLKVRVIPDGAGADGAAYSVSFSLVEKAKISRNKKDLMVAVWTKENVGRLGDDSKGTLDKEVASVLKDFHRDYLLANSSDSSDDMPDVYDQEKGPHKRKHK